MKKKILIGLLAVVFVLTAGTFIYIGNYYHAGEQAMALVSTTEGAVKVETDEEGRIAFLPAGKDVETGIIFYPGGKVEAESYSPLLYQLAEKGILTVLVPMPGNLAVLDMQGADGIVETYPEVERWYMAGHSLGGSMAASYVAGQLEEGDFAGLILLAAYSTEDLSDTNLEALSIYGEQDKVLNMENYVENKGNLPADTREVIIKGGNHAQFGDYGPQDGDGKAKIDAEEQQRQTVEAIAAFVED